MNKSARRMGLFTWSKRIDWNADTTLICQAEDKQTITTVLQEGYYESDHQQVRYYSTMETQSESNDKDSFRLQNNECMQKWMYVTMHV